MQLASYTRKMHTCDIVERSPALVGYPCVRVRVRCQKNVSHVKMLRKSMYVVRPDTTKEGGA